jgi:hypothetical protein
MGFWRGCPGILRNLKIVDSATQQLANPNLKRPGAKFSEMREPHTSAFGDAW